MCIFEGLGLFTFVVLLVFLAFFDCFDFCWFLRWMNQMIYCCWKLEDCLLKGFVGDGKDELIPHQAHWW